MGVCAQTPVSNNAIMKTEIKQNSSGEFYLSGSTKNMDSCYAENLIKYTNLIYPIFKKAKEIAEYEFISSLLAIRGLQGPGWDTFENTIKIFDSISPLKIKDEFSRINLFLWVYGHIVEASEPYELFANFLRIIDGERFSINNFPEKDRGKYKVPQFPIEKIENLKQLANKINMLDCLSPIIEIFNKDLRNSIFHSDYSIYNGCIRIRQSYKEFTRDETYDLLNKSLAYFQSLKFLYQKSISDYKEPKDILLPSSFNAKWGRIIVRKNYGVVGLRDNYSKEFLAQGFLPFRMGSFKDYEITILNMNDRIDFLPEDKVEIAWKQYMRLYKWCPNFLRKHLNHWNEKRKIKIKIKLIKHCCITKN